MRGTRRRISIGGDLFHGHIPDGAVYIGRHAPGLPGSRWANPHRIGKPCAVCGVTHDRASAVRAYAANLAASPDMLAAARTELAGRDLACWCHPGAPCHGDALLTAANDLPDPVAEGAPSMDDPRYRRGCDWPGCDAWYHAVTGPAERGWVYIQGEWWAGMIICPVHAEAATVHQPHAANGPDGAHTSIVTCSCGTISPVLTPGHFDPAYAWWCEHVNTADIERN